MKVIPQNVMSFVLRKLFHKILFKLNFTNVIWKKYNRGGLCNLFVVLPFSASNLGFSRKIFGRKTAVSYVSYLLCFLFPD